MRIRPFVPALLLVSKLGAQFGTESLPDADVGRPPRAPFITLMGIMSPGRLITDPSLPPAGPVAQTVCEELPPGGAVTNSVTTTWDTKGRATEVVTKAFPSISDTVMRYDGARIASEETTMADSGPPRPKSWNYWSYDAAGRLTEYRRGRGDRIENHDTNFRRDARGRLTSYEYRQGAKDDLANRYEYQYSGDGKTAEIRRYDASGALVEDTTQTVDDRGHVVTATIQDRDWRTKQMKPPLRVAFRYDGKGRLIEQDTGPHEFGDAGSENDLPPGRVTTVYDDAAQTKTTSWSAQGESIAMTLTLSATGETTGFNGGTTGERMAATIDCVRDDHGNWTSCRQTVHAAGVERVTKTWRRAITYR